MKPRIVDNRPVEKSLKTKFAGQAIYDVSHLIKDVPPDENTFLIFEVQGNPDIDKINIRSLGIDHGNGYPLRSTGDKDSWDFLSSLEEGESGMRTLGWSFVDLFHLNKELKTGAWKLPIYLPPTMVNLDINKF